MKEKANFVVLFAGKSMGPIRATSTSGGPPQPMMTRFSKAAIAAPELVAFTSTTTVPPGQTLVGNGFMANESGRPSPTTVYTGLVGADVAGTVALQPLAGFSPWGPVGDVDDVDEQPNNSAANRVTGTVNGVRMQRR